MAASLVFSWKFNANHVDALVQSLNRSLDIG